MKFLADLGIKQAVLPPHERPDVQRFDGLVFPDRCEDPRKLHDVNTPILLAACSSASAMWAANAATVSPSPDTADGRVHFTPANLASQFHRSLEAGMTAKVLKAIFPDESYFAHHAPLRTSSQMGDEGAANHIRLSANYTAKPGWKFVHGPQRIRAIATRPGSLPARQTREASEAGAARLHQLDPKRTLFIRAESPPRSTPARFTMMWWRLEMRMFCSITPRRL